MELELDEFNSETFGDEDIGDWELEHDTFVSELNSSNLAPSACDIPKFWEAENLSEFWSTGDLEVSQAFDVGLNLEETIERLVCDEEFDDPAVLDISKRLPQAQNSRAFSGFTGENSGKESDIWSLEKSESSFLNALIPSDSQRSTTNHEINDNVSDKTTDQLQQIIQMFKATQNQTKEAEHHKEQPVFPSVCPNVTPKLGSDTGLPKPTFLNQNDYQLPPSLIGLPLNRTVPVPPLINSQLPSFQRGLSPNFKKCPPNYAANQFGVFVPSPGQLIPNVSQFQLPPPMFGMIHSSTGNPMLPIICPSFPPRSSGVGPPNLFAFPGILHLSHPSQPTQTQMRMPRLSIPPPQINGMRPPAFPGAHRPVELARIEDALMRHETEFTDEEDLVCHGSWMNPREHMLVLNCQLRSLTVSNPYVEDYYFAVKWLRLMTKERECKIAAGVSPSSLLPPYFHLTTPVSTARLISADHHHWISRRCRFVRVVAASVVGGAQRKSQYDTPLPPDMKVRNHKPSPSGLNAVSSTTTSPYSCQLGRPTKSNINAQRIIADLSVATALEDENDSNENDIDTVVKDEPATPSANTIHKRTHRNITVFKHRRRLVTLARIERLYATVLNINETNVSLARICIKNEESRHLMGHRANLLNALLLDLFTKTTSTRAAVSTVFDSGDTVATDATVIRHRLNLDIFEVPKGVRLFPPILRLLSPEDGQICMSDFILNFASLQHCSKGSLDEYAHLLYPPMRNHICKGCEKKEFILTCLPFLFDSASSIKARIFSTKLDANALTLFSSRLGVSLLFCLLDACARNSRREDPTLFCDLFLYACRILDHISSTQSDMDLYSPLEKFHHFSALDPAFLMSEELKEVYASSDFTSSQNRLQDCGVLLRWLSVYSGRAIPLGEALVRARSPISPNPIQQQQAPLFMTTTQNPPNSVQANA